MKYLMSMTDLDEFVNLTNELWMLQHNIKHTDRSELIAHEEKLNAFLKSKRFECNCNDDRK